MNVFQAEFSAALLDPELAPPQGLVDPKGRQAGKRFNVYRNNVVVSLMDAMETAFPVVQKMLGAEFFRQMVRLYVRANPPQTPLLMFYGKRFPAFLDSFKPVAKYPYLSDVARLELARRTAYHARDTAAVDPDALSAVAPEKLMGAVFTLAPCVQIIPSPYPIVSLWEFNMTSGAPKPVPAAQTALITRPALDLNMQIIDFGTRIFLEAVLTKNALSVAFDAALTEVPDFDLSSALTTMLQSEIITEIHL